MIKTTMIEDLSNVFVGQKIPISDLVKYTHKLEEFTMDTSNEDFNLSITLGPGTHTMSGHSNQH